MDIIGLLEPLIPYFVGTIKGFGAGAFASSLGFLKNKGETFDGVKFTRTMLVGGILGALGEGFGISPETAEEWLTYPFVVYCVDLVVKGVYRRAVKPLVDRVRDLISKV